MKLKVPDKTNQLVKLAVPCFMQLLLDSLSGIVAAMILGHLGKAELTAVNMTNNIVVWLQSVFTGMALGSMVVIGRMWGDNDELGAKRAFMQSIFLIGLLGIVMMLVLVVFREPIIQMFFGNADEDVIECMRIYFRLTMMRIPATAVASAICQSLRGIGDNRTALYNTILYNTIYIAIVYPLIYGLPILKIPAMGLSGGALAGFIGTYVSAGVIVIYTWASHKPIAPRRIELKWHRNILKRIFRVGLPSSIEQFMFNGGFVILQTLLLSFGTVFQAGYQIGSNLNSILCVPSNALGTAITVLTSQALGRNRRDEALDNVKAARFLYAVVFSVIGVVFFFAAGSIARLYTNDPEVLREGRFFIQVFAVESLAVGYMQTMIGVLKGAGDTKYTMWTSVFALWICRVAGTWALSQFMNPHIAIVIGLSADFYLRAIMYHVRVQKNKWLDIVV